ncbi:MAG: hypothetical protein GY852_05340, partial [bacterium]|nr:hypothetical protein [bacterium]
MERTRVTDSFNGKKSFNILDSALVPITSFFSSKLGPRVAVHPVLRATVITLWYMAVVSFAYYGAFFLRFDGKIPLEMLEVMGRTLPALVLLRLITFQRFDLYSGLLHYVSVEDV